MSIYLFNEVDDVSDMENILKGNHQNYSDMQHPIVICDDHIAIRKGVQRILEEQNFPVVGSCSDVATLIMLVRNHPTAIIVTDLAVEETPFPELLKTLKMESTDCQVVVYSMREAPATIGLCYKAGAIAFVPKSAEPAEIITAIEYAIRGERYFPVSVATELANFNLDHTSPQDILSKSEMPIFLGYCKLGSVKALAEQMDIPEKTIQNVLSRIAKKLEAPRSTFHHIARRNGLIDLEI
ncbi:MAG TPA: response regulator transcription factor [Burkholderiaceae bacterium]|jgi:two-component system response regulator EvgA